MNGYEIAKAVDDIVKELKMDSVVTCVEHISEIFPGNAINIKVSITGKHISYDSNWILRHAVERIFKNNYGCDIIVVQEESE